MNQAPTAVPQARATLEHLVKVEIEEREKAIRELRCGFGATKILDRLPDTVFLVKSRVSRWTARVGAITRAHHGSLVSLQ
jgi:hypothetical protein